jgi:hypothetical protein
MGLVSAQSIGLPDVLRNTLAEALGHHLARWLQARAL